MCERMYTNKSLLVAADLTVHSFFSPNMELNSLKVVLDREHFYMRKIYIPYIFILFAELFNVKIWLQQK